MKDKRENPILVNKTKDKRYYALPSLSDLIRRDQIVTDMDAIWSAIEENCRCDWCDRLRAKYEGLERELHELCGWEITFT